MNNFNNVLFLFNPLSNEGRAKDTWEKARLQFPQLPQSPEDITKIKNLSKYISAKNPALVVAAGGDGTVNSVCSAVMDLRKKPDLAVMPLGFGNAIAFALGVETIEKSVYVLEKKPFMVKADIMKTNLKAYPYGLFNISFGLDAEVIHNRMNDRYFGVRSYFISAVKGIFTKPENEMQFTIDKNVTLNTTATSLMIANSPIIGRNFLISKGAKLNDGLIDCTLFLSKASFIRNFRFRGNKHTLYSKTGKVRFKAKHIKVKGGLYVQIDGDPTRQKQDTEIEIIPGALNFLRNSTKQIDIKYIPFFT